MLQNYVGENLFMLKVIHLHYLNMLHAQTKLGSSQSWLGEILKNPGEISAETWKFTVFFHIHFYSYA